MIGYGILERAMAPMSGEKDRNSFDNITTGIVVDTNDPQQMGRVRVLCATLGDNEDKEIEGVGTTEFIDYPKKRMLAIQFLGGDNFNDWVWDMLEKFNGFAKDSGCDGIEATARQGFWKWLKQDDFEQSYVVYEKRIEK